MRPSFTVDELTTICDEAHKFGKHTVAHCTSSEGMLNAIQSGIDTIVHGVHKEPDGTNLYRPEITEQIIEHGIYVNPTLNIARVEGQRLQTKMDKHGLNSFEQNQLKTIREERQVRMEHVNRMRESGVTLVCGSDSAWGHYKMGDFQGEIESTVLSGMPPEDAIVSATLNSARSCNYDDKVGSIEPGMAIVNLGTAGTANLVVDKPTVPHSGVVCHHNAVDGLWTLLGGSLSAASCYRWFRDTIGTLESERAEQQGGNAYQALNDLAAQAPAGSQGLIFLPYLNSAGAPHWNSDARAAFIGLSMTHGRAELTRSVMEGVALDMHNMMMSWSQDATVVDKLRLGGGPTNSPLWNQIQADVYGRAVQLLKVEETSVLGAAILGGVGAGVFSSVAEGVDSMVHVMSEIEPDLANHRIYSEMYNAFTQAYEGLDQNTFSILASLQVN